MRQTLHQFKNKLQPAIEALNTIVKGESRPFAKRIKRRHNVFWKSEEAEIVRNITMSAIEPLAKWKDVKHWQRKLSNKYNSREFAKLHNCRVPELLWKGRKPDTIDFDKLPHHYVIRPTIGHSCGLVFLMANSVNLLDKKTYTPEEIRLILFKALDTNPNLEFLFEEFVRNENKMYAIPDDYKIYTFNGEVAIIEVINRLSPTQGSLSCYDKNWNMIENTAFHKFAQAPRQKRPKCFNEMIKQAKRLSAAYEIFVRIDFYATDKGAVFGEFTPTPGAAKYLTPVVEKMFIELWDTHCKGKI